MCEGAGTVELKPELQRTLGLFRNGRKMKAADAHDELSERVTVSAISNRLRDMWDFGLLGRERRGKAWFYFKLPTT